MVIIGDTNVEDVHNVLPVEKTFDLMNKINIPSILMQKEDSDNLIRVLDDSQNQEEFLNLAINFPLIKSTEVA